MSTNEDATNAQQEQAPPAAAADGTADSGNEDANLMVPDSRRLASMTPGQQRWAHYTKMKKSFVMRQMRGQEFTITEEGGDDEFQDEGGAHESAEMLFQDVKAPTRKTSFSLVPGGHQNSGSGDAMNPSNFENATTSTSSTSSLSSATSASSALSLSGSSNVPTRSGSITTPGAVHSTGRTVEKGRASAAHADDSSSVSSSTSSQVSSKSSRRRSGRSSPGLGGKRRASSSSEPATMPGAVAVSNDDDGNEVTGPSIDGKPGAAAAAGRRSSTSDKTEKLKDNSRASRMDRKNAKQEDDVAGSKKNPRGRTRRSAADRRKGRGGAASSIHSLTIGASPGSRPSSSDDEDDDDDASLVGASDELADAAGPSAATTPPVFRSIDLDGLMMQPTSNIVMDDTTSVVTTTTDHSALTIPIRNMVGHREDSMSVATTSTMATEHMGNTPSTNRRATASLSPSHSSSSEGNFPMHDHSIGLASAGAGAAAITAQVAPVTRPSVATANRPSGVNTQMRMVMNDQGHTMTVDDMRPHWELAGLCVECGQERTHQRETRGLFGIMRRMAPQTIEGRVYKGYCLRCYDVHDLRQLLNDPDVPADLLRYDPVNSSMRSFQENNADEILVAPTRKRGPVSAMCSSIKFQIFCGIMLIGIAACSVGVGITLSKESEPFIPPPPTATPSFSPTTSFPTMSPTSWEWNVVTEVKKEDIESFGYKVHLSADGKVMAVASPAYDGSKGRVDVFSIEEALGKRLTWHDIGEPLIGGMPGDTFGLGMHLSGNGETVAIGSPGRDSGLVQLYSIDKVKGLTPKGQALPGPTPQCQYGFSVALDYAGNRVFIGAPQYGVNLDEIFGLVQAFDFNGTHWVQFSEDIVGEDHASRFGHAVSVDDSGVRLVVGAPLDDEKWEDGGQIHWYDVNEEGVFAEYVTNKLHGSEPGSRLGDHLALNADGVFVVGNGRDQSEELYPDAGVIAVYGVQRVHNDVNIIGFPISGTHEAARFGYSVDMDDSGELLIASGENRDGQAGSVRAFAYSGGQFSVIGSELFGVDLGDKPWYGKGPSVAVAAKQQRVAVGYESILSNGLTRSEVRIYDYFTVTDYEP